MSSPLFQTRMKKLLESELLRACGNGDKEAIAQLVDDKGVALDCIDDENEIGLQPLMIACKRGHFEIVQYLLWHNTDILDNYDSAGWSSLHWGVLNGHYLITKELIEFGADLDLQSFSDNIYPIHLSIFSNKPSICKLLDNNCKIDILYNNMYNINELLDYIQFKLKLLNITQINKFKNIIFNSKQYKDLQNKLNNMNNKFDHTRNSDTDIEIILDDDTINDTDFNIDDDDDQFQQIKAKYFNNDNDSNESDTDSSHSSSDNDNDDDIGDIMSLLPQTETDILDLGNDSIIEENDNIDNDEINIELSKQLETEIETETDKEKQIENKEQKELEITHSEINKNDTQFISNGIISINLDLLIESISNKLSEKFINKNDFKVFNEKQLAFNTMLKEEQCKSLKEIIDLNKEINDINNNINNIKVEIKNDDIKTEIESIKNIKLETDVIIDNKLTKYEEWLRLNIEDKIDKNMSDLQIFSQKQNELKLKINKINMFIKTHQTKQPSIETLKVGKIIEKELKQNQKQKTKLKFKNKNKKHLKSHSLNQSLTPQLNQSFSAFDKNNIEPLNLETDSSIDDDVDSDLNDEINIYQNIINIQQNIYKQSKKKKKIKTLKLEKDRHSAPIVLPGINNNNNNSNSSDDGIFATVEMPIVLDENNKMKPKNLRRKRSNSYSSESNSPRKSNGKNNNVMVYPKSGGYWE